MDNLRFVLFVFFVFLSYMLWEQWQIDYGPKPEVATQGTVNETVKSAGQASPPSASPSNIASTPSTGANEQIEPGQRISVTTDVLNVEIDSSGGDLRILDLLAYPVNKDQPDLPVRLLNDKPELLFVAQSGFISEAERAPTHHSRWHADVSSYKLTGDETTLRVPLTWDNGKGVKVIKTYTFHKGSYLVEMEQLVINSGAGAWNGRQYVQLQRRQPEKKAASAFSTSSADRAFVGGVLYTPKDKYEKISFDDMAETNLKRDASDGWIAMIQHYFAVAWIPQAGEENSFYSKSLGDRLFILGGTTPAVEVNAGDQQLFKARIFAGPKLQRVLETIAPGLELTVDYGNLTFIAKPIFWLIEQFYKIFNNWGWAIIFGTIVIKLLFYKLSESSYRSMANMRKLQPKLKELKEQYGEDKQQFNMKMMELYRKEKVNPLGGCLPILVQIPVFISLYWVLIESVEMRQAPFALWLTDLSSKDPYFILPAIMGVSMFIQQKLNPAPVDPIQAKVMQYFPVMFTVFFAFFPSGLVLYWVVNNILSILQQWYITKQISKTA